MSAWLAGFLCGMGAMLALGVALVVAALVLSPKRNRAIAGPMAWLGGRSW